MITVAILTFRGRAPVNKELRFSVKKTPQTTDYVYCILDANFMIKSLRGELYRLF